MSTFHNPVLLKELRSRMRGARAFVVLTAFLLVLAVFTLLLYAVARQRVGSDPLNAGRSIGKALFLGVAAVALVQVMIIVPAQAAGAIAGEKEHETYDLLLATVLPAWEIVLGKLLAALAYAVLLIVAVVPFMALAFLFGGVTATEVLIALLGLLATALLYGSVGIVWSVVSRRTITATVLTQATNVLMLLGIPFLIFPFGSLFLFGTPQLPTWFGFASYPFIYGTGWLLALHPFIALGGAEYVLSSGDTRWFVPMPGTLQAGHQIWIPTPWLAFVLMAVLASALLLTVATHLVRPVPRNRKLPSIK
ncbi:MAG: ABC transporter permease [Herpetosiphonaceae bacterium]|nr:ABC transporter permease [Herpetosiphonaceae bacterium]